MKKIVMLMAFVGTLWAGGDVAPVEPVVSVVKQKDFYVGAGLGTTWNYRKGDFEFADDEKYSKVDPAVGIKAGYTFYRDGDFSASAEGRLVSTFNSNDLDTTVYSAFLVPKYKVAKDVSVYGLLGGSHLRLNEGSYNTSKNAFAFGVGAEYDLTKDVVLSADWVSNAWNKKVGCEKDFNNDTVMAFVSYKF